jgi:hypothetical protein
VKGDIRDRVREAVKGPVPEPRSSQVERAAEKKRQTEEIAIRARQVHSRPLRQSLSGWLQAAVAQVSPKNPMGEAIGITARTGTRRYNT